MPRHSAWACAIPGYRNPEGLTTPGHVTTARDMALLSPACWPISGVSLRVKEYRYPGTPAANAGDQTCCCFVIRASTA